MPQPYKDSTSGVSTPRALADGAETVAFATAAQDRRVGTRVGKYVLTAKLGQGGMGAVYEAHDTSLKRLVALKLLAEAGTAPKGLERFLREARSAARLNHPNVVGIYEIVQEDGTCAIVMELVRGGSADSRLRARGPFPWPKATKVIADACRGLAAAHAAGLIHRDLKPSNLMIAGDGAVKLADFGLVKACEAGVSLTASGTVLGTPQFMSPEQCRNEPLDQRSDIYSLGATYFALLTGRPPYQGENPMQVMFHHCSEPVPDPRALNPDIPESCANVVGRALAKEPADRFASAEEMLAALKTVQGQAAGNKVPPPTVKIPKKPAKGKKVTTVVGAPSSPNRRRRWLMAAASIALLAGGVGLATFLRSRPPKMEGLAGKSADSNSTQSQANPTGSPTGVDGVPPQTHSTGLTSTSDGDPKPPPKRVLLVIASENFWYPDYLPVKQVLEDAGIKVTVASTASPANPDPTGGGSPVKPDILLGDVKTADFDAIVFSGATHEGRYEYTGAKPAGQTVKKLIDEMLAADNKYVAALCTGPIVLAQHGYLKEKRATCFETVREEVSKEGVNLVNEPFVMDGRIITGRDPKSARPFAEKLVAVLRGGGKLASEGTPPLPLKVLVVVPPDHIDEFEFNAFKKALEKKELKVTVASTRPAKEPIEVEVLLDRAKPSDYGALLFVGGPGAQIFMDKGEAAGLAKKLILEMQDAGRYVTAIGPAPAILANAGVMKEKQATCGVLAALQMKKAGAILVDKPVVVEGKLITARNAFAAYEFADELAKALKGGGR